MYTERQSSGSCFWPLTLLKGQISALCWDCRVLGGDCASCQLPNKKSHPRLPLMCWGLLGKQLLWAPLPALPDAEWRPGVLLLNGQDNGNLAKCFENWNYQILRCICKHTMHFSPNLKGNLHCGGDFLCISIACILTNFIVTTNV